MAAVDGLGLYLLAHRELPQASVYDRSCAIGPAPVLAWRTRLDGAYVRMIIRPNGEIVFAGDPALADMVRHPAELRAVLESFGRGHAG